MRIACVDVGTNSIRLLIAVVDGSSGLKTLAHFQQTIRLGEGVDASGGINHAAMDRLVAALEEFSALSARHDAKRMIIAGTSASRDAQNDVAQAVYARTGLTYEILSGSQEAEWSFRGAMSALPQISGRAVTCDIGGGSTEFTLGECGNQILHRCSLDLGSVRISERFFSSQPPSAQDVSRARRFIRNRLQTCRPSRYGHIPLVGASDTHRILVQLVGERSHRLARQDVESWLDRLLAMTRQEVKALDEDHLTGRDDIFPAAVLICREAMVHLGCESLTVSERSLVHGLAIRELARL